MQASKVTVGASYTCQVGRNEVVVRIVAAEDNGWRAETHTGRAMTIRDPERLRARVDAPVPAVEPQREQAAQPAPARTEAAQRRSAEGAPPTDGKRLSLLDAAARILKAHGEPMTSGDIVREAVEGGVWTPRKGGKTPDRTLYAAMLREIAAKGSTSRFQKTARGKFAVSA